MLPPLGDPPTPAPAPPGDRGSDARTVSRLTRGIAAVAVAGTLAVGALAATGTLDGSSSETPADDGSAAPAATPSDGTQAAPAVDDGWGTLEAPPSAPSGSSAAPAAGSGGS